MGAGVEGQRQLHDMLEIAGEHGLALAMGKAIRLQGDEGAADDGKQSERDPCAEQRPWRGGDPVVWGERGDGREIVEKDEAEENSGG